MFLSVSGLWAQVEPPPLDTEAEDIVLSSMMTPQTLMYTVVWGDTLGSIARRFGTTIDLIMRSNHLKNHTIREGQKLRIWNHPFTIVIDKSDNLLMITSGEEAIRVYPVSTGSNNITPIGEYTITSKLKNPTWFKKGRPIPPESKENALGTRWLGFNKPQYGIHGTIHPQLIGQQVSHGCVRMRNEDVERIYIYIPIGTKVTIRD